MNEEKQELLEDQTTETEIFDQEEDFTIETMKVRRNLRFRIPIVIVVVSLFYILRYFDKNIVFNNVNAPLFLYISFGVLVFGLVMLGIDHATKTTSYRKEEVYKMYKVLNEVFDVVSIVPYLALIMTVLNMFFVSLSPITGTSMEPNYKDDEAVIFSHMSSVYNRFDVVIVYEDSINNPYLIKRVIGLPGETVKISDNEVYINDEILVQDFIDQSIVKTYCTSSQIRDFGTYTDSANCTFNVPMDSYFVMGDNRDGGAVEPQSGFSVDSRYFGPVSSEDIFGKVVFTFKDYNLIN